MTIRFACTHCGQRLSVHDEKVGKRAKCPKCKQPITVPTSEAAAAQLAEVRAARAEAELEDALAEFVVYDDEDVELIYETEDEPRTAPSPQADENYVAVPRYIVYVQGILLGFVAVISFALGILVGGSTATNMNTGDADAGPVLLSGRITFRNSGNEQVPDEGGVVIALPATARPEQKIDIQGLRPGDEPPGDNHPGVLAIREIGGNIDQVDLDGNFRLQLSEPGRYFVLMLSGHTRAVDGTTPDREHLAQMGRYFTSPLDLIGTHKHFWRNERVLRSSRIDDDFGRTRE
jgi:hypothetical protein